MSDAPAVVITGIGLMTGLGPDRESTWSAACAGRSAARWLDVPGFGPVVGCPVDLPDPGGSRALRLLDLAAVEAWADARLDSAGADPERIATLIGLSKGCIDRLSAAHVGLVSGNKGHAAALWAAAWPDVGARHVAHRFGLLGPNLAPIAACATGLVAVLQGRDLILRGACDVALAGSADASLDPLILGAFRRMKALALAAADSDPRILARPWDRGRRGFVVGEGAAVLVLERADLARARGVLPYVELAGGALGADAYHETDLNPDPTGLARLITLALARSGVCREEVDHINVHGTGTRVNDPLECRAIRRAFGADADRISCSANKGQIGHALGAAGSVELALTALAMRDGFIPPTLNLDDPDPACDLDGTPHVGRSRPIRAALKLSIGFGGHLAAAVLKRPEGPSR
ncbi:beta-ketoacyl-[acyl-carrier-protein] synthase family protein [Isosphaeraceae bacterium EP7]